MKTMSSQHRRMLLTNRKFMLKQPCDAEGNIRGTLRNFGLKVGKVTRGRFEARVLDLVAVRPALACLVEPMLRARAELMTAFNELHKMMLDAVRADSVCRRLMTVPGVGPVTALTFRATVDVPAHFARSRSVGAHFGLTPRKWQSGEIDHMGRISQMRRRDDSNGALRRRPQHAHANDAVVVVVLGRAGLNGAGSQSQRDRDDACEEFPLHSSILPLFWCLPARPLHEEADRSLLSLHAFRVLLVLKLIYRPLPPS